jgi:hypothetical protein
MGSMVLSSASKKTYELFSKSEVFLRIVLRFGIFVFLKELFGGFEEKYVRPQFHVVMMNTSHLICGSQDTNGGDKNIGYGGVDSEGNVVPSSRRGSDGWVDDESEEDDRQ